MKLEEQLLEIGLTDKEAKVYAALLELGEANALEAAEKSGVNRVTTYVILQNLSKKGLVKEFTKKKKTYFALQNPEHIIDFLEKEKTKIDHKIKKARQLMPELTIYENLSSDKFNIRFFEGKEGMKKVRSIINRKKVKEYFSIFNIEQALKDFPSQVDDHRQEIEKNKLKGKSIIIYDPQKPVPNLPQYGLSQRKYYPQKNTPFFGEIYVQKDKAVLLSRGKKLVALMIENKIIIEGIKILFELAWKGANEYQTMRKNIKKEKP